MVSQTADQAATSAAPACGQPSRVRARHACEPCRERKRKCPGGEPCAMCAKYQYHCHYGVRRKRRDTASTQAKLLPREHSSPDMITIATSPASPGDMSETIDARPRNASDTVRTTLAEDISAMAFLRLLAMKLEPSVPPKLSVVAWNTGVRAETERMPISASSFPSIVPCHVAKHYAAIFFDRIHPFFGFFNSQVFYAELSSRYSTPAATSQHDQVLCGVVSLGSLFSGSSPFAKEAELVAYAKSLLDDSVSRNTSSLGTVAGWILRTLYLRCTVSPHAAWMASSITMHAVESSGIHREPATDNNITYGDSFGLSDLENRRRLYWIARLLNSCISYEYGQSSVNLRSTSTKSPKLQDDDFTTELITMFQIAEPALNVDEAKDSLELECILLKVLALEPYHNILTLSQASAALAIYRRLRLIEPNVPSSVLDSLISVGETGLEAALAISTAGLPWWHVANVPFQFLCVLLAMDTRKSLALLPTAMRGLVCIRQHFDNMTMQEAQETATLLIRLSQRRKEEGVIPLMEALGHQPSNADETRQAMLDSLWQHHGLDPTLPTPEWPEDLLITPPCSETPLQSWWSGNEPLDYFE